jgi:hypothetical protein
VLVWPNGGIPLPTHAAQLSTKSAPAATHAAGSAMQFKIGAYDAFGNRAPQPLLLFHCGLVRGVPRGALRVRRTGATF